MGLSQHTVITMQDGTLQSVGLNDNAQLGLGHATPTIGIIATIPNISGVKQVACGSRHVVFLMQDGTVKSVGRNDTGQLGNGVVTPTPFYLTDVQIPAIAGVKQVACGDLCTLFLMSDGTVKVVGQNNYGQLGLGYVSTEPITAITPISGLSGVEQITCGRYHTLFLMQDGTVKSVGRNDHGQLGLGHNTTPVSVITDVPGLSGVKRIVCGYYFTVFVMQDGTVKSVGQNNYGQLGLGNTTTPTTAITSVPNISGVKQVACGNYFTVFLMQDGTAKSVGANDLGQLGLGHNTTPTSTISAISLTNIKQVYCGSTHTVFLMQDGSLRAVGNNQYGQLGIGVVTPSPYYELAFKTPTVSGAKSLGEVTAETIKKFLFSDASGVKKIGALDFEVIGSLPVTEDMFTTHGSDDIASLTGNFTNVTIPMADDGALGAGKQYSLVLPTTIGKLTSIKKA